MIVSIKSYFLSHKGRRPNVRRPNAGAQTAAPKRRRPNGGAQTSCSGQLAFRSVEGEAKSAQSASREAMFAATDAVGPPSEMSSRKPKASEEVSLRRAVSR